MQNLMGRIRRCAEDYNMICAGDKIAVGVSGGKDSLSLLYLLAALRRYYPVPYELQAVTHFAEKDELPVVHNVCPADKHTKRQEVKELIVVLQAQYPDLKSKIFGAMQRQPLPNWGVEPPQREKR